MPSNIWIPNSAPDNDAEMRLRKNGPRPDEPMGEAWFMGETREMYDDLLGDLDYISTERIQEILEEIASGTSSFGAMEEWTNWFRYLMPRLLHRSHEKYVYFTLEHLITCFIALHPAEDNLEGGYPDFLEDALATLGNAMMDAIRWDGDRINLDHALHSFGVGRTGYLLWQDTSGDFSSSMFFRSKYLSPKVFDEWLTSVVAIDCPHWRAQMIVWFADAYPVFSGSVRQLSQLDENSTIAWAWSHNLDGHYTGDYSNMARIPFFAEDTRPAKFEALKHRLRHVDLENWLSSMAHISYLREAVDGASNRFARHYQ